MNTEEENIFNQNKWNCNDFVSLAYNCVNENLKNE